MKVHFKYLLFASIVLFSLRSIGQNKCQPENIYITDSVGNGSFKMAQKFVYKVTSDSVKVFLGGEAPMVMLSFRILKKECYDEDKTGFYTIQFEQVFEEKGKLVESKLKIRCNYWGAYQIELLYPNKEDRIFYIDQQKAYLKNK